MVRAVLSRHAAQFMMHQVIISYLKRPMVPRRITRLEPKGSLTAAGGAVFAEAGSVMHPSIRIANRVATLGCQGTRV